MRLGNSFGNNKGKKYRKEKGDYVYALQTHEFNKWMSINYDSVISYLKDKNIFDQDVFSSTYEKMYELILYSGIKGNNYRAYFQRAYYTNRINYEIQNSRLVEFLSCYEREDVNYGYYAEIEEKQSKLEADIMDYIYSNYDLREYEIFKMYVNLKPAVSYKSLSEITNVKSHNIYRIISKIKKDIQGNPDFIKRRKELI